MKGVEITKEARQKNSRSATGGAGGNWGETERWGGGVKC